MDISCGSGTNGYEAQEKERKENETKSPDS